MTDHYAKSVELLVELDQVTAEIAEIYALPRVPSRAGLPPMRPPGTDSRLKGLHSRRGILLKLAEVHALLGIAQVQSERRLGL